jgi:hypothetical protein
MLAFSAVSLKLLTCTAKGLDRGRISIPLPPRYLVPPMLVTWRASSALPIVALLNELKPREIRMIIAEKVIPIRYGSYSSNKLQIIINERYELLLTISRNKNWIFESIALKIT